MFTRISVLVPTRSRLSRLRTLLASFEKTSYCAELVFRVDQDDLDTQFLLAEFPQHFVTVGPTLGGYRSMPAFLEDAAAMAEGDVLMVGNDDMIFETHGWDRKILAEANKHQDGLFNIGVETLNADHFPFSVISRRAYEALGFIYDPRIFWGDIFLRDVMSHFGRAIRLPEVIVTHDWAGFRPDAVFNAAEQLKTTIGTSQYWQMHREVVMETVVRLEGMFAPC